MDDERAVAMLSALAQSTRFGVFRLLMRKGEEGVSAGDIARHMDVPQNTLSNHLNILSNAGLITAKRDGRMLFYRARVEDTKDFMGYLLNDCCDGHPEVCSIPVLDRGC